MKRLLLSLVAALVPLVGYPQTQAFNAFVTGLPAASTQVGTEVLPEVQGGATKKVTLPQVASYVSGQLPSLWSCAANKLVLDSAGALACTGGLSWNETTGTLTATQPAASLTPGFSAQGDAASAPIYEWVDNASPAHNKRWWNLASGVMQLACAVDDDGTPGQCGTQTNRSGTNITQSVVTAGSKSLGVKNTGDVTVNGSSGTSGQVIVSGGAGANAAWGSASVTAANITGITSLPSGSTIQTTDVLIASRSGTNTQVQLGTLGTKSKADLTNDVQGTLPNTFLTPDPAYNVLCNPTGSSATPTGCDPIALTNITGWTTSVFVAATTNITLSNAQTIDGKTPTTGQKIGVFGQTTKSQNGIYSYNATGAWTRVANFPAGVVINQFCDLNVFVEQGTANQGHMWNLVTSTSALTIGTTDQFWVDRTFTIPSGTNTAAGVVIVTDASTSQPVPREDETPAQAGGHAFDCVSFSSGTNGTLGDWGNALGTLGPCVISDANGHPRPQNASGSPPTTNRGTVGCAAQDNTGCITGVTATNTSVTLTFNAVFPYTPSCQASSNAATPFSISVTSASTSAVTFGFAALAGTTTIYYSCN